MSQRPPWDVLWQWVDDGQARLEQTVAALDAAALGAASHLDDWTRGHVLSHVARNADGLTNLLTWAHTGTETPMYPSPDARASGIAAGAANPPAVALADLRDSAARFRQAAVALPVERRTFEVATAQGRRIPAHEVPWMRNRELWLHHVDLDVGFTMDDVPVEVAACLVDDVAGWMGSRIDDTVDLVLDGTGETVRMGPGAEPAGVIHGSPQHLAGWLTGRLGPESLTTTGAIPVLPSWL